MSPARHIPLAKNLEMKLTVRIDFLKGKDFFTCKELAFANLWNLKMTPLRTPFYFSCVLIPTHNNLTWIEGFHHQIKIEPKCTLFSFFLWRILLMFSAQKQIVFRKQYFVTFQLKWIIIIIFQIFFIFETAMNYF